MTEGDQTTLRERILDRATDVFGGREAAERWMSEPAMALGQQRPEDLIPTPQGATLVEDQLGRMEYCVYT